MCVIRKIRIAVGPFPYLTIISFKVWGNCQRILTFHFVHICLVTDIRRKLRGIIIIIINFFDVLSLCVSLCSLCRNYFMLDL